MYVYPVTENEIEVAKKFKGKYSAGTDEIPDFVVKKMYRNGSIAISSYL
jgi:hypothetical protein